MYYKSIIRPIAAALALSVLFALPVSAQEMKEWTFMIFMAADNNLEAATSVDINELETCGSTDKVNFVAQIDRNGSYSQNSELKWSGARRFFITKDNKPETMTSKMLKDLGNVDMADPIALADFVSWTKENFPAKKYALILWNHGTGWKEIQPSVMETDGGASGLPEGMQAIMNNISYNISYDDTSKTSMNIPALGETLARIKGILGKPLDLIGFDACLMQMIEVSWTAAPYALYQVGSPDLEPDRGWPYDLIAKELTKNPAMDGRILSEMIPVLYKKSYTGGTQGNKAVVLSTIDLSKTDLMREKINAFCNTVRKNIFDIDKIENARNEALKYSYGDYIDLGHFLEILIKSNIKADTKTAATALYRAISGSGKNKSGYVSRMTFNGEKFAKTRGLSIFFPTRQGFRTYQNRYKIHSFCSDTEWFNFLKEVSNPDFPYMKIEDIVLEDGNKDGRIAAGEEVTVMLSVKNLGKKALEKATIKGVTSSELLESKSFEAEVKKLPAPGKNSLISAFKFKVRSDTPVHSEISLSVSMHGQNIPVSTIKTTFYVKEAFASTGHALLVISDNFSPASPVLQQMMQSAGIKFDTWDRALDGDLKPEVLKRYLDGWVLIAIQDSTPEQSLNEDEINALDSFLRTGGRVVLNGQDIAFSLRDTDFLKNRCKAKFVQDDVNVHVISGESGFAGNKSFQIFGGDGANNQKWPDEIDPLKGAVPIIRYEEGARDMADDREMNGPNHKAGSLSRGIKSSGVAGVKVEDGYRLMLFTFGIEAINSSSQRKAFMKDIARFMQPDAASEIRNLARTSAVNSAAASELALLERADMISSIEKRLLSQIKLDLESNQANPEHVLQEIRKLPEDQQKALRNLEKNIQSLLDFKTQHGTLNRR